MSCANFGRGLAQAGGRGRDHLRHVLLEGRPHLLGCEHDDLRPPRGDFAPSDLGPLFTRIGKRGTDGVFDRLGRSLADGDTVHVTHVGLNGRVEVEAPTAQRPHRHHTTEGDDGHFRGSPADVDHHVAHRLVNGQTGADGGRHAVAR